VIKRFFIRWVILTIAVVLTAWVMPGVTLHGGVLGAFWVSALFAVVNLLLGSLIRLFTLPVMLLTLGLFGLVVNGLMFRVTSWISSDLQVSGFPTAFLAGLVITVITMLLNLTPLGRASRKPEKQRR
jgi:putative membrane protein